MKFVTTQHVEASYDLVKEFYGDVSNLKRISPPFPRLTIQGGDTRVVEGREYLLNLDFILFKFSWLSKIEKVVDGGYFIDTFRGSIFKVWRHAHKYEQAGGGTLLTDNVDCTPSWWFTPFAWLFVKSLFVFRKRAIARVLK